MRITPKHLHTLRYLKPVQVYGRVWNRLQNPKPSRAPAPPLRTPTGLWQAPPLRPAAMLGPTTFRFLNQTHDIASDGGWQLEASEKLWLLNLHYFDDLVAVDYPGRRAWHTALIADWIQKNPPTEGIGWEAYALSLRIVNWIKWHLAGNSLSPEAIQSLAVQTRYLAQTVEWYLLGNHVLANAKGLVFAGLFFSGPEADQWLSYGMRLLTRELKEEILPDGGHFERSPMYHSIILEDVLDLYNLSRVYPDGIGGKCADAAQTWPAITGPMRKWLKLLTHPDGQIAFFNDAACGIAHPPSELDEYARSLGLGAVPEPPDGLTHLPASGYIRVQTGEMVLLFDVGEIGPSYIPGHAHADTLSFELSLFGKRAFVNSGTSVYKVFPQRQMERGTAAHNTVVVDGEDSSEVWGSFRVARRAHPYDLEYRQIENGAYTISCAHDGYERLPGRVRHKRTLLIGDGDLRVTDFIEGRCQKASAYFHLHPDVAIMDARQLHVAGHALTWSSDDEAAIEPCEYHPEFGMTILNHCLVVSTTGNVIQTGFRW